MTVRILALDLALNCGAAFLDGPRVTSELWRLDARGSQPHDRFVALAAHLDRALTRKPVPTLIAYEELHHLAGRTADSAHSYGGLRGVVLLAAAQRGIHYLGVAPATWKRAAGLGSGTGEPEAMEAAQKRWPGVSFETADECVARWVGVAAMEKAKN